LRNIAANARTAATITTRIIEYMTVYVLLFVFIPIIY